MNIQIAVRILFKRHFICPPPWLQSDCFVQNIWDGLQNRHEYLAGCQNVVKVLASNSNVKQLTWNSHSIDILTTSASSVMRLSSHRGWDKMDAISKMTFFNCISLNENVWIPIEISLKFVPKGPINNIPTLVLIMAWRRLGDKPLSESMMVSLLRHIWVTRPQWVIDLHPCHINYIITDNNLSIISFKFPRHLCLNKKSYSYLILSLP